MFFQELLLHMVKYYEGVFQNVIKSKWGGPEFCSLCVSSY